MVDALGGAGERRVGLGTVSLCAAEGLKKGDGDEAARVGQGGVAGLVPVRVRLAADDVEEVAAREAQLLAGLGLIVVERTDDLS